MLKVILFLACICGIANALPKLESRIVGGENATLGEIPYIVSIRGLDRHGCGGTIISKKFVVTAAHCVHNWEHRPDLYSVQYGVIELSEKTPNVLPVKRIIKHKNYEHHGGYKNDIALIEVKGTFKFGPNVQPVELPNPFETVNDNEEVLLAGWGLDKTGGRIQMFLKKVFLVKFTHEYCEQTEKNYDHDYHLCAGVLGGGRGQCSADSGGPLTVDGKLFGIVSWSIKPCANPEHPGMFTKVTTYRNWIWYHAKV